MTAARQAGVWVAVAWVLAGCGRVAAADAAAGSTLEIDRAGVDATTDPLDTASPMDGLAHGEAVRGELPVAQSDAATLCAASADIADSWTPDAVATADTAPQCPLAAPPDATAADLGAPPAPCPSPEPPPWWPTGTAPAPTLPVLMGRHVAGLGWQALQDGQWTPLQQGGQGGGLFHLALAPKVLVNGTTAPVLDTQVQLLALQGCAVVASADKPKFAFVQATDPEDWYVPDPTKALVAVFAQSGEAGKHKACAAWLQLVARVRVSGSGAWGESQVLLRAYDDTAAPVGPKP